MKVLLEDRALHGNRLVARKFGKSRFKNDKMGHFRDFRRPCVNYSQEKNPDPDARGCLFDHWTLKSQNLVR